MTEKELMDAVVELATLLHWDHYHTHDSRRSQPGFPDLVLAKGRRLIVAEIKSAKGRMRPYQQHWLDILTRTGAETYLWRPADWLSGEIEATLRGTTKPFSDAPSVDGASGTAPTQTTEVKG